jgi:hypothetical protein
MRSVALVDQPPVLRPVYLYAMCASFTLLSLSSLSFLHPVGVVMGALFGLAAFISVREGDRLSRLPSPTLQIADGRITVSVPGRLGQPLEFPVTCVAEALVEPRGLRVRRRAGLLRPQPSSRPNVVLMFAWPPPGVPQRGIALRAVDPVAAAAALEALRFARRFKIEPRLPISRACMPSR